MTQRILDSGGQRPRNDTADFGLKTKMASKCMLPVHPSPSGPSPARGEGRVGNPQSKIQNRKSKIDRKPADFRFNPKSKI